MKDERIMKKIGLFYAANAVKTSQIAKKIREALGTCLLYTSDAADD